MYFSLDWLNKHLPTLSSEKEKNEFLIHFITGAADFLVDESYAVCKDLLEKGRREKDAGLQAFASVQMALYHLTHGNHTEHQRLLNEGEQFAMTAEPSFATVVALQMCAFNHWSAGERDRGLEVAYASRKMAPDNTNEGLGWSDFQLGVFHSDLKDYESARKYFLNAEKMASEHDLTYQLARVHSGLAAIDIAQEKFDDALIRNEKALAGYRKCGQLTAVSRALNDLGVIYSRRGDNLRAKENLAEAMHIRKEMNYRPGLITTEIELARVFLQENNFKEA
ncbi:MAG TPA: tetratricopeptide repeat protein, partial [Bacteroidia bacterium]|nr:tetratricopeptide repeat protein [Bacteroidia bacterium]